MKDPLQEIPGVGPNTAQDLRELGIQRVEHLVGQDPEDLYARLCKHQGGHSDRCNLYVYRCAIYWAEGGRERKLLDWWAWKDAARPPLGRLRCGSAPVLYG
ncbi:MAG: helix-hairpin-helix domain-containing protein [Longimicrobiales bacterium]